MMRLCYYAVLWLLFFSIDLKSILEQSDLRSSYKLAVFTAYQKNDSCKKNTDLSVFLYNPRLRLQ